MKMLQDFLGTRPIKAGAGFRNTDKYWGLTTPLWVEILGGALRSIICSTVLRKIRLPGGGGTSSSKAFHLISWLQDIRLGIGGF